MADPYAGIGGGNSDPYGGVGVQAPQPRDPYAGVGGQVPAPQAAPPPVHPGAQGWGMVGQMWQDLTDPNRPQHAPNDLEQGVMNVAFSKPVQSLKANYDQAVDSGLFMQPTRAVMEGLGVGRQPGESDASLHARYSAAVQASRQDAQQRAQQNTVGAYDGDPVHVAERAAQQVGSLGAGIVANPQYFLLPGGGGGGSIGGRIAQAGAVNAGIGSASDAAAQLMDMAEGDKKNFDITQNLQQAVVGGAFGAGLHGTIEVAPYIKGLFANRGMDTTPAADPRQSIIQPMTTDHIALNAADHMQLQQLMQTGSVDDIKGFFADKQGPRPSWSSVNRFVDQRDNPDFQGQPRPVTNPRAEGGQPLNYNDQANAFAEQQYASTQRQAVQDHVDAQTAGWANAPNIEVVHGPEQIADPQIRQEALAQDGGNALGFYGRDGTVRMYSGRINSPEQANALLFHEGLGHHGLNQAFGDQLDTTLGNMLSRNVNQFSKDTDAWMQRNPGAYGGDRIRAAEEVLAERSEQGAMPKSWTDALQSTMMRFGRRMGLKLAYSDAEVRNILSMAHDSVINGTDVRGNGYANPNQDQTNKFMQNALGEEQTDPEHLSQVDQLKQDPRYWQDQEYRSNVNELARLQHPIERAEPEVAPQYRTEAEVRGGMDDNKFMRSQSPVEPGYQAEDLERIYKSLDENYTPSKVSWEDTRDRALKAGFSPDQIGKMKARNPGELAVRLYQMQSAANLMDMQLARLHEKLDTGEFTEKDQADYIKAIAQFHALVPMIKGERAELARALQVSKAAGSYSVGAMDQMRELLEQGGSGLAGLAADPTAFFKFARQMKALMGPQGANGGPPLNQNPQGTMAMINGVNKPYWEQYLTTAHMNMMLSALSTHIKAPIDMATGITRNVIEKAVAMPIGKVRQAFEAMTGRTVQPGVETAELANHMFGIMKAVSDAEVYRQAWNAAKTGNSSYVVNGKATPTNFANQFGATSNPHIPGVSIPTQLISAQDTFFRSVEINAQLLSLGAREARSQLGPKASTTDVMTLGHILAMNPLPSMIKEAYGLTNRTLLLNDNPLNNMVNKARVYTPGMNPGQRLGAFLATNLMPFIRVESNSLINRIIQRTPLGLIDPTGYTQSQLKAGGAKADIAMAKMLYGTVLIGMMWAAADKGKDYLTGDGPGDINQYKEKIASGWRPDAVHENGKFITGGNQLGMSVNPFDMHNKTAQMVASMREAYDAGATAGVPNGLKLAFGSLMSNLSRQSWASDIDPAIQAVTAQGQEGQSTVQKFANTEASSWVPNIFGQTARNVDPYQRDVTAKNNISGGVQATMQSEIPGLRKQLPIKYSVYGKPLENGASWTGVHTMIPGLSGNGTTQTSDPTEMELDRLNTSLPDIAKTLDPQDASELPKTLVTPVQRTVKVDGVPRQLSPEEFEKYQQLAGQNLTAYVQQEMSTPAWSQMSDYDKVLEVRSIESDVKQSAKEALFGQ